MPSFLAVVKVQRIGSYHFLVDYTLLKTLIFNSLDVIVSSHWYVIFLIVLNFFSLGQLGGFLFLFFLL